MVIIFESTNLNGKRLADSFDFNPATAPLLHIEFGTCTVDADCDDANPCTDDTCVGTVCSNTNNTAACDDASVCTPVDTCFGGVCVGSAPIDCNDDIGCTIDGCDPGTGCTHTTDDSVCDNGMFCDGGETCDPIVDCVPGSDPCPGQLCDDVADICVACVADAECDDGDVCTTDTCFAAFCQYADNTLPCDDSIPCTTGDACALGVCSGTPVSCTPPDFCQSATGTCATVSTLVNGNTVQSGSVVMTAGAGAAQTVNVTISSVPLSSSILFFNLHGESIQPGDGQVRGQLTSPTNIQFFRENDSSLTDLTIQWYVVDFVAVVDLLSIRICFKCHTTRIRRRGDLNTRISGYIAKVDSKAHYSFRITYLHRIGCRPVTQ